MLSLKTSVFVFFNCKQRMESIATKMKKSLASLALISMGMTFLVAPVAHARLDFTDYMEIPAWAEEAIEELIDQGVVNGNDDGSFAPNRQLNRAEVSKVIVLSSGVEIDTAGGPHFPDVQPGTWYYDYIETMYNQGWINGYPDGYFRPSVGINRAEIAKMVVNAFEIDQDLSGAPHFDDVGPSDWYYGYIETSYNNGLMRGYGDGSFGPANAVTRAETVKITYDSQLVVAEPSGPAEGTLEVMLSDDTPRGTNVPYNATSVPYTTLELTASDDSDVEVSSIIVTRLGLGDNDDFDNVWLEIDGFKIGNDRSINNEDIVELRFNPPVVVPAGQTLIADVVTSAKYSDDDKNIGHHNRLAVVSADDIVSTAANVVGDFPIEGEEMEIAQYAVSNIQFTTLGSDTNIDVGDNFIEIGKFRMLNQTSSNKDIELRAITFKNGGTAEIEDDLENVALYVSGEQISAETIIDGDYITFRLDNGVTGGYIIEDGDSKIFSIRADVVSAEKDDDIAFKIDNYEDIVGVEIGTSFGIKALSGNTSTSGCGGGSASAEDQCATLKNYSIKSGDLNLSRDPASLGNQTYAPGSNDVVFLTARAVVDQPLIVDGLRVDVSDSTDTFVEGGTSTEIVDGLRVDVSDDSTITAFNEAFDNFRFYLNDRLIDSENDLTGTGAATTGYLNFNTTFEIAGTSILKIVGNVTSNATAGDKVKLEIVQTDTNVQPFASPEYISTGDQVSTDGVLGSAQGSFVTVQQSVLSITKTDGLTHGDKIVAGVDDVEFIKFVLDNNDSGDVNVTSLSIVAAGKGSASTYSNFTAAVFVDGTQQGSAKNLDKDDGDATFNDLSVIIPSAAQKEFVVVVDTMEASVTDCNGVTVATDPAVFTGTADTLTTTSTCTNAVVVTDTVYVRGVLTEDLTVDPAPSTPNTTADDIITVSATFASVLIVGDTVTIEETGETTTSAVVTAVGATSFTYSASDTIDYTTDATVTTTEIVTDEVTVTSVDTATDIITFNGTAGYNYTTDATVTLKHELQLSVFDVDADNVDNGDSVVTEDSGGTEITIDDALDGVLFELVQSGSLNVNTGSTVYSDLLVANSSNVEVLKIRFNAADDEVQVKDIYLENDQYEQTSDLSFGDRATFKLYNASNQLIQEKQMTDGTLHFELGNLDRIRVPKDDSVTVTVKVDIRDITKYNQTGARLQLALDADGSSHAAKGIAAVTAATGTDIDTPAAGWGDVVGQEFVAYRTQITIKPATSQPSITFPSPGAQEFYRFTVTADSARQAELGRVSFLVSVEGVDFNGGNEVTVLQIKADGTQDNSATVTSSVFVTTNSDLVTVAPIAARDTMAYVVVNFANQVLSAGESRTYGLKIDETAQDGDESDDDAVTVEILQDTAYAEPATKANALAANAAIIWSDESSSSHSDTTQDWMNGYLLDIDTQSKKNED